MHQTSTHDVEPAGQPTGVAIGRRTWLVLVLLCAAQFMLILDITVVNVALPSIQADIGLAMTDLQWVITAYTLAFGGLIILGGRAGDLFGRRRMFMAGLALFTVASLVAALAPNPGLLITARAAQGIGAALLSPSALALITVVFPEGAARHRALAIWAAVAASGGAVGVLIGGILTEAFGWQAIFLINVPVGVVIAAAVLRVVPAVRPVSGKRLDPAGALLATGSLVALIYGLVQAESAGWASGQTLVLFALALAGVAAFVLVERVVRNPLVPLSVFRRRPTVVALVLMILGMGPVFSGFFFSSLYLQTVLGHSALRTGVEFLPVAVAIVAAAHAGGHLISRFGAKPVIATGLAVGAVGAVLLSRLPVDGDYLTDLLPGFLLLGVGGGLAAAGVMITAMSGARSEDAGLVSGLTNTAHELSIALTLPVLSTIAAGQSGLGRQAAAAETGLLTEGITSAFLAAAGIAAAGVVVTVALLRRTDVATGVSNPHGLH
ncbi:MAG TPA: MFS transporter [Jiangellaceae bacterium]|nr:MFS transporter [Jiangellaceae bacterium]